MELEHWVSIRVSHFANKPTMAEIHRRELSRRGPPLRALHRADLLPKNIHRQRYLEYTIIALVVESIHNAPNRLVL